MSDAVVLTVATGGYAVIWAECIASHAGYARRHRCKHVLIDREDSIGMNPKWVKLREAAHWLERGVDVAVFDADALISVSAPDFRDVLRASPDKDIFMADGRSGRPNSGVIFLRGGAGSQAAALLQACLNEATTPIPKMDFVSAEGENGHLIHILKRPGFAHARHRLDSVWNRTEDPLRPGDWVAHFTGPMRAVLAERATSPAHRLNPGAHPLAEMAGVPRDAPPREVHAAVKRGEIDVSTLKALVERAEHERGMSPPPVEVLAPQPLLWRYERATDQLERSSRAVIKALLGPGDHALDVGAHIGVYTADMIASVGSLGRVVAVEPEARNFKILSKDFGDKAEVFRRALGAARGPTRLQTGTGHTNHGLRLQRHKGNGQSVTMTTIDHLVRGLSLDRLKVIKVDVEGAELEVLKGATEVLVSHRQTVWILEINPRQMKCYGARPSQIVALLADLGYELRRLLDDGRLGWPNFVLGTETYNYLITHRSTWPNIRERLAVQDGCHNISTLMFGEA